MSNECDISVDLDQEEDSLAKELKENYDNDKNEIDPHKSADKFHKLAKVYAKRKPEDIKDRMICLIKSAALFNAAIVRSPENIQDIKKDLKNFCKALLQESGAKKTDADLIKQAEIVADLVKKMREVVEKKT